MKKIFSITILAIFLISLHTSCSKDFLEEDFKSQLTPGSIKTDGDAANMVNGIYSTLLGNGWGYHGYGQMVRYNDLCSDVLTTNNNGDLLETFQWTPGVGDWKDPYEMINRANTAIEVLNKSSDEIITHKNQYLGEAVFLRALGYYDLIRQFGDVPYHKEARSAENADNLLPRTPKAEIIADLVSELRTAADNLPAKYNGITVGHATKGAALTLMVKLLLLERTVGDGNTAAWTRIRDILDEIIGLGVYHLFTGDYKMLWNEENRKCDEFIFVAMARGIEYDVASNHHVQVFTPWSWDAGWGGDIGVPAELYFTMDVSDQRRHGSMSASFEDALTGWYSSGGGYYGYPYTNTFTKYDDVQQLASKGFATGYATTWSAGWMRPGAAVLMKYSKENKQNKDPYEYMSALNQPIFRYADVLLLKAEAENELGNMGAAEAALNQVRARVGAPNITGLSQQEFRDALLNERALELVGEGMRKEDLIRYGVFESTMNAYFQKRGYTSAPTVTADYRVFPIPQEELDLNPNMTGNPLNH